MINKNNITDYSIKELEKIFSDIANSVTLETHDVRYLKQCMFDELKKRTDIGITCSHTSYDTFSFRLKYFNVEFSISVKTTGRIRQITKLRAKDIKKANGIKLKRMYTIVQPFFNQIQQDKTIKNDYILKLDDKWHLTYDIKLFHEVKDKNLKLSYIISQEYFNTYIDSVESLQEKLKKELIVYGCQSIFMYSMFNREWVLNPNPYKKLMKKFGYTYDDDGIKQFVYDRNKQFIDNTVNAIIQKINNNER